MCHIVSNCNTFRTDVDIPKLLFESSDDIETYWKNTYRQHGYDLQIVKNDRDSSNRHRYHLACVHFGKPTTRIHADNRERNNRSKKTGCTFKVYYSAGKQSGFKYKINSHNLEHTCSPIPQNLQKWCRKMADLPPGALDEGRMLFKHDGTLTSVRGMLLEKYNLKYITDNVLKGIRLTVGGLVASRK